MRSFRVFLLSLLLGGVVACEAQDCYDYNHDGVCDHDAGYATYYHNGSYYYWNSHKRCVGRECQGFHTANAPVKLRQRQSRWSSSKRSSQKPSSSFGAGRSSSSRSSSSRSSGSRSSSTRSSGSRR